MRLATVRDLISDACRQDIVVGFYFYFSFQRRINKYHQKFTHIIIKSHIWIYDIISNLIILSFVGSTKTWRYWWVKKFNDNIDI